MVLDLGRWRYRDRYAGYHRYGGHEIAWKDSIVIWMMNYIAKVLSDLRSMADTFDSQRKFLASPTLKSSCAAQRPR